MIETLVLEGGTRRDVKGRKNWDIEEMKVGKMILWKIYMKNRNCGHR